MKQVLMTLAVAALVVGCGQKSNAPTAASAAPDAKTAPVQQAAVAAPATAQPAAIPLPLPNSAPAASPAAAAQAPAMGEAAPKLTGKVVETLDAASYTYVRLSTDAGEKWAAIPAAKLAKGQVVTIDAQMVAEKFESKTLNRKFDKIVFGTLAGPNGAAAQAAMASSAQMPAGHPSVGGAPAGTGAAAHMQAPEAGDVKVAKAEGGKTVAEIWAAKENGKEVVVRGKVVKFLSGIMGKNWIHLRDGSGSKSNGDDDITVTTNDVAAVGDVVVVRGKVTVDKDFGAGYRYPVIIEEAKVSK